jgi:hypothetical protein
MECNKQPLQDDNISFKLAAITMIAKQRYISNPFR